MAEHRLQETGHAALDAIQILPIQQSGMTKQKIGLLLLASVFLSAVHAGVRPSQVDCTVRPFW